MSDAEARLPLTLAAIRRGIDQRLHLGAQLYVALGDDVVANEALGEARPGVPMRTDTIILWLSAGKPLAAVAIAQLWQRGLLELDDPVAKHIPEFAAGGKEKITIRHILTHTAGFRAVPGLVTNAPLDEIIAAISTARIEPQWIPGVTAGYHPLTSWYILGEIIRRLDGRAYEQYVREMICAPAGMTDTHLSLSHSDAERVAPIYETSAADSQAFHPFDKEGRWQQVSPGGSARGPARDLARFYEMLLRRGRQVLSSQSVEALTARHRAGMYDQTFRHVIDFGLGFILQSNQYGIDTVPYNYGPHASPRTFGHSGSRSSVGYCDPEHGLVVACIFNGAPTEAQHDARMREVNTLIYEELNLLPGHS